MELPPSCTGWRQTNKIRKKIQLLFRYFSFFRSCLHAKNLLWLNCHSRFFYKLKGPQSGPFFRLSKKFDSLLRDTKRTTRAMRGGCFLVSPSTLFRRKNSRFCALRTQNRLFFLSRCRDSRYMPGNPDVIFIAQFSARGLSTS